MKKKVLSLFTALALMIGILPATAVSALGAGVAAALTQVETIGDEYITASVSKENGGFTVTTAEGDRLNKSDNNKDLLYHDGRYDTSFLSFRVGNDGNYTDYLFGGSYPDAGSTAVAVNKNAGGDGITAVWELKNLGLTFTQSITLVSEASNEHGMVSIAVSVENSGGSAVPVQARLLLDTCLGSQDYGYYQYADASDQSRHMVSQEQELAKVPEQLYAVDDPYSPSVMAYTVHTGSLPTKVAFGHWCHLGATLFDFTPIGTLDFTSSNSEYMTADSAYALYYDLGTVAVGGSGSLNTYYGVYSHRDTPAGDSVAVDVTAPIRLELNRDKTDFEKNGDAPGKAHFTVSVTFTNINQENAQDLSDLVLAVRSGKNLRSLDDDGEILSSQDFDSNTPATISYENLLVGQSRSKTLNFQARCTEEANYERIIIGVYDVSQTNGQLSDTYKLGETTAYVLLPGTDNGVPKVNFAAMTPKIIYTEGTRHLFVTVGNEAMLENTGNWDLWVCADDGHSAFEVGHEYISIKDGVMDVALSEEHQTSMGAWHLELRWTDSAVNSEIVEKKNQTQTAPELSFTVSSDPKYKNDSYGVLIVREETREEEEFKYYVIESFLDEEAFEKFKEDYDEEIIFIFKGNFTAIKKKIGGKDEVVGYTAVSTKTTDTKGNSTVNNSILINDCLDFEEGTLSVYLDDNITDLTGKGATSAVCVEFDGKLYTNKARTSVWNGKGMFTPLKQGVANYSHLIYDEDGNRGYLHTENGVTTFEDEPAEGEGFTDTPIYLVWPTTGEIGRTISGMIFDFTYGVLGTMYDTDGYSKVEGAIGDVISFSAMLDLTFLQGKVDEDAAEPNTYWNKMKDVWLNSEFNTVDFCTYDMWLRTKAAAEADYSDVEEGGENKNEKKVSASVMVHDVIFGCGEGFVGINFAVGVAIKNYIAGLPNIEGTIKINTINNWSYGVDGKFDLEVFTVEASVSIKSKNNIPVPDELYVFVSFEDAFGINIDGLGFLWITGGGGGIKNLYDTIFYTKTLPPLKLLLSVSFEILKVMECEKATLSLGLTGISLTAENIGVKAVPGLTAISKMGLSFEWYPGIDLRANIVVNLFAGVIYGGGYVVLISPDYKDVFFEMFARARVQVPASIPVVGGVQLGGVDLGISTEKIWGALEVLFVTLGVTYYWGEGSVDFGSGNKAKPTFPDLLGYEDVPVAYDAETDQTLYMRVGTNTQLMASNLPDDGGLKLMASSAYLKSNAEKNRHSFNLGTRNGENDAIVQISFEATEENYKTLGNQITVGSAEGKNDYGLILYSGNNLETANANLTYEKSSGRATYAFTVTENDKYEKEWYMTTPEGSDVLLYNVEEVPEMTEVSGTVDNAAGTIALNWSGKSLADLDQVSFYLTESNTVSTDPTASVDPGYRIDIVEDGTILNSGTTTLSIPADVPSGEYYVRAVYSKADEVNGAVFGTNTVTWENQNTPGTANITAAKAAGNLQYELTIAPDSNTDGYLVSIYDEKGNVTDFERVGYEKAETGNTVICVGGRYNSSVQGENGRGEIRSFGLEGGQKYQIGVTPYKTVKNGNGELAVRGDEKKTDFILLPEMRTPVVTFSANKTAQTRTEITYQRVKEGKNYVKNPDGSYKVQEVGREDITVFADNDLTITASIDEKVTGTWKLDNSTQTDAETQGQLGSFSGTSSVSILLADLAEGGHTLVVEGTAEDGDTFTASYVFTVDTLPPQLLLDAPVNGGFFHKNGTVTFAGTTDADARFTVECDGDVICDGKTIQELGGTFDKSTSAFSFALDIPDPNRTSQRTLTVSVSDDVDNATTPKTFTVSHGGLADLQELAVSVDGVIYQFGNIPVPVSGLREVTVELVGFTSEGTKFAITGDNVSWSVLAVEGTAKEDNGKFTAESMSRGILTGKLAVANGAFRTATLCFGAPANHFVSTSATIGGTVTGGGEYAPGTTVTLTATPDNGYRFAGWTISGATVADTSSHVVTFLMPDEGNVTAHARFEPISGGSSKKNGRSSGESIYAKAGELVQVKLPTGKNENSYLPWYTDKNGNAVLVSVMAVVGGYVTFIAPESGTYRFMENEMGFSDVSGHWAENAILFCASRGIFYGTGGECFAPGDFMTRAMFATVLYRLAGSPAVDGNANFTDVERDMWYSDAIIWGQNAGILAGYGDGRFGIDDLITREQMCVLLTRYLKWAGYDLPFVAESRTFQDSASVSDWAMDSVVFCQRAGLLNGKPGNLIAPQDNATRAENCTIFQRMIQALFTAPKETSEPSPVRVGFLDSGVSTKHLNSKQVEPGENFVFPDRDTQDRVGHGTATAGLVLGSEELGLFGTCPEAVIIPLVCYDVSPTGLPTRCDGEGLARAVYAGVDTYHCDILNISMGLTEDSTAFRQAVEYAREKGVLVISAVGNDNLTNPEQVYYPAAYEGVIGVGSADGGAVAAFSQRNNVDILTQGVDLQTVTHRNTAKVEIRSGTSYSCAVASGICAAIWQSEPELTAEEVQQRLFNRVEDIGAEGYDTDSGWGIIN